MPKEQRIGSGVIMQRLSSLHVSYDFDARREKFGFSESFIRKSKRDLFGYLLGFLVGDAAKKRSSPSSEMFLEVQLTKKHEENEQLGEFVGLCANACGIPYYRINDRVVNERLPHGRYHWKSQPSPLLTWTFGECLGLKDGQLTTYDPVSIDWIPSMEESFRTAFVQGLADSDGYVHLQDQEAHIIVSPNLVSVSKILDSMNVEYRCSVSKGMDIIKIRCEIAARIPLFSPRSYRYDRLMKLSAARRLGRGPWPRWLALRVDALLRDGYSTGEILRAILDEYRIAIRASNVRRHRKAMATARR